MVHLEEEDFKRIFDLRNKIKKNDKVLQTAIKEVVKHFVGDKNGN